MRNMLLMTGLVLLLSVSCKKDAIDPYSAENNSICFAAQSSSLSFRGVSDEKKSFFIPLTLIGCVADYDREVTIRVMDSDRNTAVENKDFVLKRAVVKVRGQG